ncbi:HDOD domain-containing protein [Agarilytica rhodophyticola]|uniref:HDOD domain-containing protein n=1 Tax=Agarilytica rhodophyticola TaxID=1737490 RepID=UPI000B344194|nr:HDOD domain-containing protein [Agarilytica rhodophyticola]
MALKLANMFTKKTEISDSSEQLTVGECEIYSISRSKEAYFRYLYPKKTSQKLTVPQKLVINVLKDTLQKKAVRQKTVPRLPSVIPKLLKSLRDPDSSAKHYVSIINKDPVMSAAVLKLANSVYFNPIGRRIDDIEKAVVKLGLDGLRTVLSAAVMQPIIQKDSSYFSQTGQKMWQHCLTCAVACEIIAEHRGIEKFKVYIMGLVHDMGLTTIFSELCKQFEQNQEEAQPGYNAFVPIMKVLGPAVNYWIAKDWELPKDICSALAEQTNIHTGMKVSPYAHILYQANFVSEVYVTLRRKNEEMALGLLKELSLPIDLYDKLDLLSKDV